MYPNYRNGELVKGHSSVAWTWSDDGAPTPGGTGYTKRRESVQLIYKRQCNFSHKLLLPFLDAIGF